MKVRESQVFIIQGESKLHDSIPGDDFKDENIFKNAYKHKSENASFLLCRPFWMFTKKHLTK